MKKIYIKLCYTFIMMLTIVTLCACESKNSTIMPNDTSDGNRKIKIVATIFPIYDIVRNLISNDNYELTLLLDSGIDIHNFSPTAKDIAKLAEADLFIYVGGESDNWVDKTIESSQNNSIIRLNLMESLFYITKEEEVVVERKEIKEYDINSILEKAKDKRESDYEEERHRKLNNTQIDILKNIKIKEENESVADPDITGPIDELNTEEKTIVDLIQDIQKNSKKSKEKKEDLFSDLMGGSDDTIVAPIEEEATQDDLKEVLLTITQDLESIKQPESEFTHEINLEKEALKEQKNNELTKELESIDLSKDLANLDETSELTEEAPRITEVDKSFYTNSMAFNKADFEGYEDLEKGVKKSSIVTKIAIAFIIILLIATIVLILNFIFDWNLI